MTDLDIMKDASEIVHYIRPDLPLRIAMGQLALFPNRRALCHWHNDVEFIRILTGSMRYCIGDHTILLQTGDSLFVNTRQLHYGFAGDTQDCTFLCVLFHPTLLNQDCVLYREFVSPILQNTGLPYLHFAAGTSAGAKIAAQLDRIYALQTQGGYGYELTATGTLYELWQCLLPLCASTVLCHEYGDTALQKEMVSFIYGHYAEKLTLRDIAAAGHVSKNKCCAIFKQYTQQSPISFLNAYRLEVSRYLLTTTADHITEIALTCGFNSPSYFTKLFLHKYGITPSAYRTQQQGLVK